MGPLLLPEGGAVTSTVALITLASLTAWLTLRLRAERRHSRDLQATIDAIIEDEQSSEMVARAVVLESVRREARAVGGVACRGGQS
jgi:hypothetical protein